MKNGVFFRIGEFTKNIKIISSILFYNDYNIKNTVPLIRMTIQKYKERGNLYRHDRIQGVLWQQFRHLHGKK